MTKYLNFFESESGFTEAVGAGELFFPNVSYTEDDDTVHWKAQSADPVETPMLRMHFSTSTPGQRVRLRNGSGFSVTAMEIDGTPVNYASGGTYDIASPGNHTAVYQFASPAIPNNLFFSSNPFTAFTSAEITSAVTSIGNQAFAVCGGLSGVSISDSVTTIGTQAFSVCTGLTSVAIPDSVTTIGSQAFSVCSGLTSVTIPDSVTAIGFQAFSNTGLRSVTVPASVTSMSGACFLDCTEMGSATIGSGITAIPAQTFRGCTSLQFVTLPGNLTAIGQEAFAGCTSLLVIIIPSGVTTIGERAFDMCTGLTAIHLSPETPPTLGADALANTNDCPIYVPAASVETYKQAWPGYASRIMPIGGGEPDQYSISASVNDEDLGEVHLDEETALEGDQVDFEVEVYEEDVNKVASVTITDGNGDEVECTNDWDNHYSFTMPASDVTISVVIGEKQKYTVTVDSTDDALVSDVRFLSDDGEPSFPEGNDAEFTFLVPGEGEFQVVSVQASDCEGGSIEVNVRDWGSRYHCNFPMPGCDTTVFIEVAPVE